MIWYYLVHDNFFVSGLDWGTIIALAILLKFHKIVLKSPCCAIPLERHGRGIFLYFQFLLCFFVLN